MKLKNSPNNIMGIARLTLHTFTTKTLVLALTPLLLLSGIFFFIMYSSKDALAQYYNLNLQLEETVGHLKTFKIENAITTLEIEKSSLQEKLRTFSNTFFDGDFPVLLTELNQAAIASGLQMNRPAINYNDVEDDSLKRVNLFIKVKGGFFNTMEFLRKISRKNGNLPVNEFIMTAFEQHEGILSTQITFALISSDKNEKVAFENESE